MRLDDVARQINELTVGQPANKSKFCEHIEKVIREAEKHRQYLLEQWRKAKEAGLVSYDESKKGSAEWTWSRNTYGGLLEQIYFTEDELCGEHLIQFYIKGEPEANPLTYLCSMLSGCVGQVYKGFELLDYQFVLLAIIHDAQSWHAGQEMIYFNIPGKETLSDRLCRVVWRHLSEYLPQRRDGFPKDVRQTIETALLAVKAKLQSVKKPGSGNTETPPTEASIEKTSIWTFAFEGKKIPVDGKLKGLKLIEILLTHPGKEYYPLELLKEAELVGEQVEESELIYESGGISATVQQINKMQKECDNEFDPAIKAEIQEEIDKALGILKKAIGKTGKSRKITDRYRIRVETLAKKVLEKIKNHHTELYNHFVAFLKTGVINYYKPDKPIMWNIK